jgi:hypothetical protein
MGQGQDPPTPPKRPLPKPAAGQGPASTGTRPVMGAQSRLDGPRTTARPPPVVIGPGAGAPDPRALGRPSVAPVPARGSPTSPTLRPAPPRRLAQTLQGTGAEQLRAANRVAPAAPPRASRPPGPSPAGEARRPIASEAQPEDEATHFMQRPPVSAVPSATDDGDDADADPTRVISRRDLPVEDGRTPALHLPSVVVQPAVRGAKEVDEEPTRVLGSQSWPPSDMAVPGPAMPLSNPPPAPTVILRRSVAQPVSSQGATAGDDPKARDLGEAPFVPPEDVDAPPELKGLAFRTVSTAPLRPGASTPAPAAEGDSLHNDTTSVSSRKLAGSAAFFSALTKQRDKLVLFGAGTLAGVLLFGLGFLLGNAGRSTPVAAPAVTNERPAPTPAVLPTPPTPPAPPTATQAKQALPAEEPAPAAPTASAEAPERAAAAPLASATGRSITSLALDAPTPTDRRARTRTSTEPRKTAAAPAKPERAAEPPPAPAPAPVATKQPEPEPAFPEPKAPPPAPTSAPRKGYVSPIQAPGF